MSRSARSGGARAPTRQAQERARVARTMRDHIARRRAPVTRSELVDDLAARLGNAREVDVTLQWLLNNGLVELAQPRAPGRSASYALTPAGAAWSTADMIP